jgi:hypothetical protein
MVDYWASSWNQSEAKYRMSGQHVMRNARRLLIAVLLAVAATIAVAKAPTANAAPVSHAAKAAPAVAAITPSNPPNPNKQATCSANCSSTVPVYDISDSNYGVIAHSCEVIGTYNGHQAVQCADLYAQPDDGIGVADVYSYPEAYCQDNGYEECAEVQLETELATAGNVQWESYQYCQAGTSTLCSKTGRNYGTHDGQPREQAPTTCGGVGSKSEFWAVNEAGTFILVPGDHAIYQESNFGTKHAIICYK